MKPRPRAAFLLACGLALGGCATHTSSSASPSAKVRGAVFQPHNYISDSRIPAAVRRVVLLPVHGGEFATRETAETLDGVFATALERQLRFEVVTYPRREFEDNYGVADVSSADELPHGFLADVGERYGAQAVIFIDVTAYDAYRPLVLGVRAKMATIQDKRLIWSFDEVFATTDPTVANGVRRYYQQSDDAGSALDLSSDNLQSPGRFASYAADTVFKTLPPR